MKSCTMTAHFQHVHTSAAIQFKEPSVTMNSWLGRLLKYSGHDIKHITGQNLFFCVCVCVDLVLR
jgi:hypothetical protein